MIIVGAVIAYLVVDFVPQEWPYRKIWELRNNPIRRQKLITLEIILFTVPVIVYGHSVVKRRATFLQIGNKKMDNNRKLLDQAASESGAPTSNRDPQVDVQFYKLHKQLEKLCEE